MIDQIFIYWQVSKAIKENRILNHKFNSFKYRIAFLDNQVQGVALKVRKVTLHYLPILVHGIWSIQNLPCLIKFSNN